MKTFWVIIVSHDNDILLKEKALGNTEKEVYNAYREEYSVTDYPQVKYIDVVEEK